MGRRQSIRLSRNSSAPPRCRDGRPSPRPPGAPAMRAAGGPGRHRSGDASLVNAAQRSEASFHARSACSCAPTSWSNACLLLLILASFWSWVLIIDKWLAFSSLKRKAQRFEKIFWSGRSLDELYAQHSPSARSSRSPRCSSPRCANGGAPSKAARRARRCSPASRTASKRR